MPIHWPSKDPLQIADYDLDWSGMVSSGDAIATYTCVVLGATSLTVVSTSASGTLSKAVLSGGLVNMTYTLLNTIVTAAGETFDLTTEILIKAK